MTSYIKIKFRNEIYGSIRAPTTIGILCYIFKLSPRSMPTLVSLEHVGDSSIVISDLDAHVDTGFYELVSRRDVEYDPAIDELTNPITRRIVRPKRAKESIKEGEEATSSHLKPAFPIPESEMNLAIRAMLQVVGSIPPRYLKFNAVLAKQIDHAISEVMRIQHVLSDLQNKEQESDYYQKVLSKNRSISLPLAIHITFIQYRIMHILYETWKTVWLRGNS